jgi:hypothetical protein
LFGRHEGRRILEDLGVDGNGSNGSSALLIILPDEDNLQFLYRITVYIFLNGVHNVVCSLLKHKKSEPNFALRMTNDIIKIVFSKYD